MTKTKTLGLSLSVLFAALLITGATNAFAGMPPVQPPDFDSKFVLDDGSKLDVDIFAVSNIPTTPPGFIGYGTIIGMDGDGDPVLRIGTSHAGVCDSEDQTFGVCEGIWHNHDAILRAPENLAANIDIDGDEDNEAIQDCFDQNAMFEAKAVSFQSPGTVAVSGVHFDMSNIPKTSVTNTNVIPQPFINNFDFSQNPLVQKSIYPVVKFRIFVATADGLPALDADLVPVPIDGERRVCIFDVMVMDSMIGGELLSTDTTALMVAGLQSSAIWMLPALAGAAGAGAYYIKGRMNKD